MNLNRALFRLIRDPEFRLSDEHMIAPNGGREEIRKFCVEMREVADQHVGPTRAFWGTVVYTRTDDDGTTWLYTEPGPPKYETYPRDVRSRSRIKADRGCKRAGRIVLPLRREDVAGPGDKVKFMAPADPQWFTVRLARS